MIGPANDTPEVLIEIDAAEIAADHEDWYRGGMVGYGSLRSDVEADGWIEWERQEEWNVRIPDDDPDLAEWQAAWLARQIAADWLHAPPKVASDPIESHPEPPPKLTATILTVWLELARLINRGSFHGSWLYSRQIDCVATAENAIDYAAGQGWIERGKYDPTDQQLFFGVGGRPGSHLRKPDEYSSSTLYHWITKTTRVLDPGAPESLA